MSSQKKKSVYILEKEKNKSRSRDVVVVHFLQKCYGGLPKGKRFHQINT